VAQIAHIQEQEEFNDQDGDATLLQLEDEIRLGYTQPDEYQKELDDQNVDDQLFYLEADLQEAHLANDLEKCKEYASRIRGIMEVRIQNEKFTFDQPTHSRNAEDEEIGPFDEGRAEAGMEEEAPITQETPTYDNWGAALEDLTNHELFDTYAAEHIDLSVVCHLLQLPETTDDADLEASLMGEEGVRVAEDAALFKTLFDFHLEMHHRREVKAAEVGQ
jgi:hypothetical protein